MTNNLGLFVTHHMFLTDDQIAKVVSGEKVTCVGHCVPVWVDAKTGKTTEPANEIFCRYDVFNSAEKNNEVVPLIGEGYEIWLPRNSWEPPPEIDFESMAEWTSEQREAFQKERDMWWFNNPRLPDASDLAAGYIRFEFKEKDLKVSKRRYSAQHIVEVASLSRMMDSLTT